MTTRRGDLPAACIAIMFADFGAPDPSAPLDGDDESHDKFARSARRRSGFVGCGGERDPPGRHPEYAVPMGAWNSRLDNGYLQPGSAARTTFTRWLPRCCNSEHPFDGRSKRIARPSARFRTSPRSSPKPDQRPSDVVRIDQYYTSPDVVDGYHQVRREFSRARFHRRPRTSAPAFCAPAAVDGSPGHGSGAQPGFRRPARKPMRAPTRSTPSSGYSPALSAGDFRFVPGQTAEALNEAEPGDRSRGATRPWPVEGHRDQARDRFHHPAEAQAHPGSRQRRARYRREGSGVFARAGRHPGLSRGLGTALSGRARDHDHRHRDAGFHHSEVRIEINTIALARDGKTRS